MSSVVSRKSLVTFMSRKNRFRNKKKRWSRRERKLMQTSERITPAKTGEEVKAAALPKINARSPITATLPERKKEDMPTQESNIATLKVSPNGFDEAKQREIKSHLAIVLLVSGLCLVLVGLLYFLELKINWVERALALSFL